MERKPKMETEDEAGVSRRRDSVGQVGHHQSRRHQESPGHQRRYEESPGHQRRHQESPGHQRRHRESLGHQRRHQDSPGHQTRHQESPGHQTRHDQEGRHCGQKDPEDQLPTGHHSDNHGSCSIEDKSRRSEDRHQSDDKIRHPSKVLERHSQERHQDGNGRREWLRSDHHIRDRSHHSQERHSNTRVQRAQHPREDRARRYSAEKQRYSPKHHQNESVPSERIHSPHSSHDRGRHHRSKDQGRRSIDERGRPLGNEQPIQPRKDQGRLCGKEQSSPHNEDQRRHHLEEQPGHSRNHVKRHSPKQHQSRIFNEEPHCNEYRIGHPRDDPKSHSSERHQPRIVLNAQHFSEDRIRHCKADHRRHSQDIKDIPRDRSGSIENIRVELRNGHSFEDGNRRSDKDRSRHRNISPSQQAEYEFERRRVFWVGDQSELAGEDQSRGGHQCVSSLKKQRHCGLPTEVLENSRSSLRHGSCYPRDKELSRYSGRGHQGRQLQEKQRYPDSVERSGPNQEEHKSRWSEDRRRHLPESHHRHKCRDGSRHYPERHHRNTCDDESRHYYQGKQRRLSGEEQNRHEACPAGRPRNGHSSRLIERHENQQQGSGHQSRHLQVAKRREEDLYQKRQRERNDDSGDERRKRLRVSKESSILTDSAGQSGLGHLPELVTQCLKRMCPLCQSTFNGPNANDELELHTWIRHHPNSNANTQGRSGIPPNSSNVSVPCLSSRSSQDKNIEQDNVHVELESVQEQNIDGKDLNMIQELPAKIDSKLNYILKEKKSSPMKSGKWLVSKRSISSLPAPALKPPKNFNNNVDTFEAEYLDDDEECVIELVVPPSVSHPSANAKKKDDVPPTSSSVPESNSSSSSSTTTVHETIGLDDNIEIDIYQDEQRDEDDISVIEIEGSPMNDLDLGGKEVLRKQDDASSNSRSPKKQTVIELDGSPSPALDTSANALPQNDSPPTSKTDPCPVLSPSSPASPYYQTIELDINDVEFESVSDENDDDSDSVIELEVPPKPDPDCLTLSSGDEEEEPENESTNETPTAPQSESDPAAEHGSDESHSEVEEEHTIISPNRKLDPETDSPMVKINEPNYESGANFSSDDQLPLLAPKTEALLDSRDGVDMPGMPNVASAQVQLSRNWIRPRQLHRCSECETAINGPYGNLYRHEMEVHGKQRPFSCPHCEYRSGHSHHVDTHIKGVHLGLKRYFCYCRRGFLFPSQVRAHWRKSHGNIHKAGHFVVGEDGVPVMRPVNISNP